MPRDLVPGSAGANRPPQATVNGAMLTAAEVHPRCVEESRDRGRGMVTVDETTTKYNISVAE